MWQQVAALGSQIVFWRTPAEPFSLSVLSLLRRYGSEALLRAATMMHAPDRTARALAATFRIYLVANGNPGDFVEPTGRSLKAITTVEATTEWGKADGALMMHAELDLDRTFIHQDNNCGKLKKMCADHAGKLVVEIDGCNSGGTGHPGCALATHPDDPEQNGIMLVRAVDRSVSVRALCKVRASLAAWLPRGGMLTGNCLWQNCVQEYGIETDRDYIWRERQGINSLRQVGKPCPGPGQR